MADTNIYVTLAEEQAIYVTIGGEALDTLNHAALNNLDYDHSGHTGFQKKIPFDNDYKTFIIPE